HPRRHGEDAGTAKWEPRAQDRLADRAPEPAPGRDALARGAVHELAGLARHPEGATLEARADVLGGPAVPGELEVVHQAGAVHRHRREAATLDQVDDDGPEPDLDRVRAHAEDDRPTAAERPRDALDGAAEIARGEDVRQPGDEPAHRHPGPDWATEARRGHKGRPPGERHRADARHVERDGGAARAPRTTHLRLPEQAAIDELAEHVSDQDVRLLDARRVGARGHAQAEIDQAGERPAVAPGEPDGLDAELPAHVDRAQHAG